MDDAGTRKGTENVDESAGLDASRIERKLDQSRPGRRVERDQ